MLTKNHGFTLIEVAILLVIVGTVAVGGLTIVSVLTDARRSETTLDRLDLVEKALQSYVEEFSCLPCPANGALSSALAENNFGRSLDTGGLVGGNCTANACQLANAVVPWRTLGLSEEQAVDGWGNRIRYTLVAALRALRRPDYKIRVEWIAAERTIPQETSWLMTTTARPQQRTQHTPS